MTRIAASGSEFATGSKLTEGRRPGQKGFGQAVFRAKSQAQHQIALQKTAVPALELKREQTHAALEAAVRHLVERLKLPPKEASERRTASKNGAGSQPHAGFPVEVHRHLIFLLIAAF